MNRLTALLAAALLCVNHVFAASDFASASSAKAAADPRSPTGPAPAVPQTFVFEGDSLSVDNDGRHYPSVVMAGRYASGQGEAHKFAVSGSRLADVVARYNTGAKTFRPSAVRASQGWLFLWIGANDWATANPADWLARWKAYLAQARADGFQLCVFTVMRRADVSEPVNRVRDAINEGIRVARDSYEILIDVETLFDPSNRRGGGYHDGVHLPSAAQGTVGRLVADALLAGFANDNLAQGPSVAKSKVIVNGGWFFPGIRVFDTTDSAAPQPRVTTYRPDGRAGQYLATRLCLSAAAIFEIQYAARAALGAHTFTDRPTSEDRLISCNGAGTLLRTLIATAGPVSFAVPAPANTGRAQMKVRK